MCGVRMTRRIIAIAIPTTLIVAAVLAMLGWFLWRDGGPQRADATDPALVARGEPVYRQHCASCHGVNLEGEPNWMLRNEDGTLPAPPHDATGHTWHHPDAQLFETTKFGTAAVVGSDYKTNMPGFADSLGDEDIWAVLAYIKSQWPPEIQATHARREEDLRR